MDIVIIVWQDRGDRDDNLGDDQPSNDSHAADLTDTWQLTNKRASLWRIDQSEASVTLWRVSAISPHVSCHKIVTLEEVNEIGSLFFWGLFNAF